MLHICGQWTDIHSFICTYTNTVLDHLSGISLSGMIRKPEQLKFVFFMIIQYYKIENEKKSGNFNSHESQRTLLLVNLVNHVSVNALSPIQNLPAIH